MSFYPEEIYSHRDLENVPGQVYDETKKTRLFVEDLLALINEFIALETVLGLNVQGEYETLVARLAAMGGGGGIAKEDCPEEADGILKEFTSQHEPFFITVSTQVLWLDDGFTYTGTGPYTITFFEAPWDTPKVVYHT